MTDAQLAAEFARLNEQITALVGLISNIEGVIMYEDRRSRADAYNALMEASEADVDRIFGGRVDSGNVQNRDGGSGPGLEELGLTGAQLAEVQKALAQTRAKQVLGRQPKARRKVKK